MAVCIDQLEAVGSDILAAIVRIHHLALRTGDVDTLVGFYQSYLGMRIVRDSRPRSVWLSIDDDAVLMIEAKSDDEPSIDPRSLELIAFATTPEARSLLRDRLVAESRLEAETEHTLYFRDPDGRRTAVSTYPL